MNSNSKESLMLDTGTTELLCEIQDRVALVTLNKPEKKNALGDILTPALRSLLPILEARGDVGCVMLTGAGNAFCAGGDVSEMGSGSKDQKPPSQNERIADLTEKQRTLTGVLYNLAKPTIAALPGPAAGAGLSIALACDLRIASNNAILVTAFRNVGLTGDYGASWFLPRLIGLARAKSLMYFSPRLDAKSAMDIGLVDQIFHQDTFHQEAMIYAKTLALGPTLALGKMKHNLQAGIGQSLNDSFALEAKHMIEAGGSSEAGEAIRAFMEKRQPEFHPTKQ